MPEVWTDGVGPDSLVLVLTAYLEGIRAWQAATILKYLLKIDLLCFDG